MKVYKNGQFRELTEEEIKNLTETLENSIPSLEERLAAMESAMIALMGVV